MKSRQRIFMLLLGIIIGYGFHDFAYDTSINLLKSAHLLPKSSAGSSVLGDTSNDSFITRITFDGTIFEPRKARVHIGNYISIKNTSKHALMWLVSDLPEVNTTRGYAEGEQFQFTSTRVGTYSISNTLVPGSSFTLIVEK